jgi:hypothetical protein
MDPSVERAIVQQWKTAQAALREVRKRELAELSDEDALRAADALLGLVAHLPPKDGPSGLVEQQRRFTQIARQLDLC